MANDPGSSTIVDGSIHRPVSENSDFPLQNEDSDLPPGMASVEIVNYHSEAVCFITISPSEEGVCGDNWLAEGDVLYPGSRITFYIEAGFLFDGVAQSFNGEMFVEEYELSPSEGKNAWMIGP